MRICNLKRKAIPKIGVLFTGFAAAVLVATISPAPAMATPRASSCAGCHGAATAGTVTATASTATPAAGSSYTVDIAITDAGNGGLTGYGIVPVAPATEKTFGGNTSSALAYTATMTAPATAGTYSYTVWSNQGPTDGTARVGSVVYSITVGSVVTTPPPTSTTTTPAPTSTTTTPAPTSTTPAPTSTSTTPAPTSTLPTPGSTDGDHESDDGEHAGEAEGGLSPTGALGVSHLSMYNGFGSTCGDCHDGTYQPAAPSISVEGANMEPGIACATCHGAGKEEADEPLFISLMNDPAKTVYSRCSDCHTIASDDHSDD